jgi:hypothetical protein
VWERGGCDGPCQPDALLQPRFEALFERTWRAQAAAGGS